MKKKFLSKKLVVVLVVCVLISALMVPMASATDYSNQPKIKYTNFAYAYDDMVMNVYNWSAYAGDTVSLYTESLSDTQKWYKISVPTNRYNLVSVSNTNLALCYDDYNTPAIVQNKASVDTMDYRLDIYDHSIFDAQMIDLDTIIYGNRRIGTSGNYDGAPLYWYRDTLTSEEMWQPSA